MTGAVPAPGQPQVVLVIDEIQALEVDGGGLRVLLDRVLVNGRAAGLVCLGPGSRPTPTWLGAGDLAAYTSSLVADQVRQATEEAGE